MGFSMGYWYIGLTMLFFYGGMGGSLVRVLQVGLGLRSSRGSFGGSMGGYRLLWFGSSGGRGGCAWLENGNGIC